MKTISIIIPYNRDRGWLHEAVESVPDWCQLILSKGDRSWPANFNEGLKQATGDFVKFLHEDDKLVPGSLEKMMEAFEQPGWDRYYLAHGQALELYVTGKTVLWTPAVTNPTLADLLSYNCIHSSSLIYRREVFDFVGRMNETPKVHSFEEYEFNLRCLSKGLKIGYVDTPIAYYRRHPQQIIRTVDREVRLKNRMELLNTYRNVSR